MTEARVPCCIDGCRRSIGVQPAVRTFGHIPTEWICPTHWQRVPRSMKRVWSRLKRKSRRFGFSIREPSQLDRLWSRIKREAGS
jgi:hypothetical protein